MRLLFNCISKAKITNSIVLCVTVNFPPPCVRVLIPAVQETMQRALQSSVSTARDFGLCLEKALKNMLLFSFSFIWCWFWFFPSRIQAQRACGQAQEFQPLGTGTLELWMCTKKKWSELSALSSCQKRACCLHCSSTVGRELRYIYV